MSIVTKVAWEGGIVLGLFPGVFWRRGKAFGARLPKCARPTTKQSYKPASPPPPPLWKKTGTPPIYIYQTKGRGDGCEGSKGIAGADAGNNGSGGGRPDLVKDCGARVYPVGRLDLNSEGLLLMTNDGELAQRMTHPSHEVSKTYHVSVSGAVEGAAERLSALTDLEGEPIRPAQVSVLRTAGRTAELSVTVHEGKNRQVRRMCAACGLSVRRLRRVQEHTLELGILPSGAWRYLTEEEIQELKQL